MIIHWVMDTFPLWGVFLATVVIIGLAMDVGFRLGRRTLKRSGKEKHAHTSAVVAASLGLLAFMLAFTFGAVSSRIDLRKQLVLDEANAVGTAYLRADLLPEAHRAEIRRNLEDYVTLRIDVVQSRYRGKRLEQAIAESEEILSELWSRAVTVAEANPTPMTGLFIQSLNTVIDLHQARVTVALEYRLPTVYWLALYSLAVLAMVVAGYDAGFIGERRSLSSAALVLAFSVIVLLVVAFDRPQQSPVTQQALIDLLETIRSPNQSP